MGMGRVGRAVGFVALVLGVMVGALDAFPYGSAVTHLEVTEAVLGGYGGNADAHNLPNFTDCR